MNFLELCQRARRECGGEGPTTVVGQVGELARLVGWVQDAWDEIQVARRDWRWMWVQQSKSLTAGAYQRSETAIDFRNVKVDDMRCFLYSVALGNQDIQPITYLPWEEYSLTYNRGPLQTGRPTVFSIMPNRNLILPVITDQDYTFVVEYHRRPTQLEVDADTPGMPWEFHMAIVWKAVMKYATHEGDRALRKDAKEDYAAVYKRLVRSETPEIRMGDPLE